MGADAARRLQPGVSEPAPPSADVVRRSATPIPTPELRVCVFELAGQRFGLRLESVSEVVPMAALSRPPAMPVLLEGFLNLRGTVVPVLRIARVLGLAPDPLGLHTPLIIVRSAALPLALLVNRVTGIISLRSDEVLPIAESDSFNGCVQGRLTTGGDGAVHLLSLPRLLLTKEQQMLAHFRDVELLRLRQTGEELL